MHTRSNTHALTYTHLEACCRDPAGQGPCLDLVFDGHAAHFLTISLAEQSSHALQESIQTGHFQKQAGCRLRSVSNVAVMWDKQACFSRSPSGRRPHCVGTLCGQSSCALRKGTRTHTHTCTHTCKHCVDYPANPMLCQSHALPIPCSATV